jgi:hypothetical protein
MPIVPNLGMAASLDPVALDAACADLVNAAPALPGSELFDKRAFTPGSDKFTHLYPGTDWRATLRHAEEIGLGKMDYRLERI